MIAPGWDIYTGQMSDLGSFARAKCACATLPQLRACGRGAVVTAHARVAEDDFQREAAGSRSRLDAHGWPGMACQLTSANNGVLRYRSPKSGSDD